MIDDFFFLLERTLKLDVRFFLKNQIFLSIATLVNIASGFILSILFARYVSQNTFGQYSFVFFLIATLEFTGLTGLRSTLPFAISKRKDDFYITAIKLTFLGSFLGLLILLFTALYYTLPDKPNLAGTLVMSAIFFPFVTALSLYSGFFTGKEKFLRNSIYSGLQAIFPNLLIALVIFIKPGIFWLVFAGLFGQAILNVLFTFNSLSLIRGQGLRSLINIGLKTKGIVSEIAYGLKLSLVWLIPIAFKHLDKILVAKLLGFEGVAIYTFAILIPQQIANFLKNIQPMAIFKLSSLSARRVKLDLPLKSLQLMAFILPLILLYIFLAPFIFKLFYPAYEESIFYSQIYSLGILFFPTTILTQSFHHLRKISNSFRFSAITSLLKVTLVIILVPTFGLTGAALSFVIYSLLEFLVALTLVKKLNIPLTTKSLKKTIWS